MAEYIEKEAFIRSIEGNPFTTESVKSYIRVSIKRFPAADVRENVKGEWETQELAPTNWRFCSKCGFIKGKNYKNWNFCPNCGAKMEVQDG